MKSKTNWNSHKQLKLKIYGEWEQPISLKANKVSTSIKALTRLKSHFGVAKVIEYRSHQSTLQQLNSYENFIDRNTNSIHPYIDTLGAATGRCTSSKPNLQNIKKESAFRDLFVARPGHKLIVVDFSQIEPRVLAHFVKPSKLSDLFYADKDFYTTLGNEVFSVGGTHDSPRNVAKVVVLATIYGMWKKALAEQLKVSMQEAQNLQNLFFLRFPEILNFRKKVIEKARVSGFSEGLLNRRRYIANLTSTDEFERSTAERKAFNAVIQGSAATIFKAGAVRVRSYLSPSIKFLLHVHDELILEAPDSEAVKTFEVTKQILEEPQPWFSIPIKVDGGIGRSWAMAKSGGKEVR